jgi:3-oxoacyl-[acyl-carrier-protein] synthase-1
MFAKASDNPEIRPRTQARNAGRRRRASGLAPLGPSRYSERSMTRSPRLGGVLPVSDYSLCCALGCSRDAARERLLRGQGGLRAAPFALPFAAPCGVVPDPLPALPARLSAYDTRQSRLALAALEPLLPAVARSVRRWGGARVALVLGSSNAGLDTTERVLRPGGVVETGFSLHTQHAFAAVLSLVRELTGIAGPAHFVSTACSSSGKAFASAARLVHAGLVDAALVGGVDALCEMTVRGFRSLGVLAEQPCRPFAAARPGINIGEGAALFLLERAADSELALLGTGESADAHHMTAPDPSGAGAEHSMRAALEAAGVDASEIDLINAHGTGTAQGDAAEAAAIARVFGAPVPVVSTKGYTGHALGAAGAVEAALSLITLENGFAPESLGASPIDPALPIAVLQAPRSGAFRRVLSNSFAFGGSNVSVILGRAA